MPFPILVSAEKSFNLDYVSGISPEIQLSFEGCLEKLEWTAGGISAGLRSDSRTRFIVALAPSIKTRIAELCTQMGSPKVNSRKPNGVDSSIFNPGSIYVTFQQCDHAPVDLQEQLLYIPCLPI